MNYRNHPWTAAQLAANGGKCPVCNRALVDERAFDDGTLRIVSWVSPIDGPHEQQDCTAEAISIPGDGFSPKKEREALKGYRAALETAKQLEAEIPDRDHDIRYPASLARESFTTAIAKSEEALANGDPNASRRAAHAGAVGLNRLRICNSRWSEIAEGRRLEAEKRAKEKRAIEKLLSEESEGRA